MYCCKECQSILFKEEWKLNDKELKFNKFEHIEFKETSKIGLPIVEMICQTCHSSVGYVKQNPIVYIPYKNSILLSQNIIEEKDEMKEMKKNVVEQKKEEIKEEKLIEEDKEMKEDDINEIKEEKKENTVVKTIKSILYFGLIHLPIVTAFFSD